MSKQIEYFLDCSSPWTYLSFKGITDLQKIKDFEIIWKPILVGGIFNSINPSVYESRKNPVKEKLNYSQKDMNDWVQAREIEINWPAIFPINSVKAMVGFVEEDHLFPQPQRFTDLEMNKRSAHYALAQEQHKNAAILYPLFHSFCSQIVCSLVHSTIVKLLMQLL